MNPGLSFVVGPEALTKLRDVNRVTSNQTTPIMLLIVLLLGTGVG